MTWKKSLFKALTILGCLILSSNGSAREAYSHGEELVIASLAMAESSVMTTEASPLAKTEFKEPLFTGNKWHQYFGLGSLALATLAAIAPKPSEDDAESGVHHTLAQSAAVVGGAAVVSGLVFHYEDLSWNGLFRNPDNWHALLGTLGTLGYVAANSEAPEGAHSTYGIIGAVSMLAAIKITW